MKKVGIITFHNSYNCGSMLESFAMQKTIEKLGMNVEIINFSNEGQKKLYSVFFKNNSFKNILKNILLIPYAKEIRKNNDKYQEFMNQNFNLSKPMAKIEELEDKDYSIIIAGSDQIWNITIEDSDDAYFLPWVKNARKVAYAPSFGSKNIMKFSENSKKYADYLNDFNALSIRENNGQKWIKHLIDKEVPVLLDPTLLIDREEYDSIMSKSKQTYGDYIFFYSPSFDEKSCNFVKKIAEKNNMKVITWSAKSYYVKLIKRFGFILAEFESPSIYLELINDASLVITTSYHGTIFSTIYRKKFITIKNGGMYGDDDRVMTLLTQIDMLDRLLPADFDDSYDYLMDIDYSNYEKLLAELKNRSLNYITENVKDYYERIK